MTAIVALNLGCGYQTSERCLNIDWSLPVRLKGSPIGRRVAPALLTGDRRSRYDAMTGQIKGHDLRKGIPFKDGSADVVYHSHVLEHIDRGAVPGFFAEILRVLKPGGVHRIVVPDLEQQAREYLRSLDLLIRGVGRAEDHEEAVHVLIEQLVRREAYGSSTLPPVRRRMENLLLGDARKRGETHQWMWDRVSLPRELLAAGFKDPLVMSHVTSRISDWRGFRLDETARGEEYKPGSLYVEAVA